MYHYGLKRHGYTGARRFPAPLIQSVVLNGIPLICIGSLPPLSVSLTGGKRHRCKGSDRRRRRHTFFDLNKCRRRTRALAQARRAVIARQDVRIAVSAGCLLIITDRVVPGAAGQPDHPRPHGLGEPAPAKQAPRALKTRTTSPFSIPRRRASSGLIASVSRPAVLPRALTGPASIWLCNLSRGWLDTRCSGNAADCLAPSHSAGSIQVGCGGQSS